MLKLHIVNFTVTQQVSISMSAGIDHNFATCQLQNAFWLETCGYMDKSPSWYRCGLSV
jgi:hypothetical protein